MGDPAPRLPVTVVAGFAGAGKSTLIGHWLRTHPVGERWALLANASAVEPADDAVVALASHRPPASASQPLRSLSPSPLPLGGLPRRVAADGMYRVVGGCACCTAQASARSAIIELLRAGPWDRLVVELDGAAHPAALVDLLRRPPLDALLRVDGLVTVVDSARPAPFETEPMHPLAQAQVEVAARIVLNRAGQFPEPRRSALVRRLAEAPPFGRIVDATEDGCAAWASGPGEPAARGIGAASPGAPFAAIVEWRRPADEIFDRARLQALVAAWPIRLPLFRAAGAFRTERDWYRWRFDGSGMLWEACAYRLENRLRMALDPARPPEAADSALAAIAADLASARIAPARDDPHGGPDGSGV